MHRCRVHPEASAQERKKYGKATCVGGSSKWRRLDSDGCTPLLVFVNRGSGGRQGAASLLHLRRVLSPHQVVDMDQGNAEEVLQCFSTVGRFRVLVCGGDGTVGWVLSLLDGAGLLADAISPVGSRVGKPRESCRTLHA